jgi:hypothetical protein
MRVYVDSVLRCPAETVWNEVQRPALLLEIIRPLVRIVPADHEGFPERWLEGATTRWKTYLFGIIPLGTHSVYLERIDSAAREIQSRERDPLIHRWDHLIRVRAIDKDSTHYSDEIIIEAGWTTFLVWLFAQWFYRHRQRRWRRVAHRLMAAAPDAAADRPGD